MLKSLKFGLALAGVAFPAFIAAPAAVATPPHALPQIEQVNRADGLDGQQPLVFSPWADGAASAVSEDGRFAVFQAGAAQAEFDSPIMPLGLYVRDTLLGTTRALSADGFFSSIDRRAALVAFYSSEALDPADTNEQLDLYAWNRLTGRTLLLSRENGLHGAATGLVESAGITTSGLHAVFATASGVYRRNLLTGQNTRVGDGTFATFLTRGQVGDAGDYVSADGRVIATSEGIVSPDGTWPLGIVHDPTYATNNWRTALVSESGNVAVVQDESNFWDLSKLTRIDTRTGERSAVPVSPDVAGDPGRIIRVLQDDRRVVFSGTDVDGSGQGYTGTIDLVTGALTKLPTPPGNFSHNLRYAIWSNPWQSDRFTPVSLQVSALPGNRLPGRIETPSPMAWAGLELACKPSPDAPDDYVLPQIRIGLETGPLPAESATIRAWNAAGRLVVNETVTTATADPVVGLPVGENPSRVEVKVRLADGRITKDTQQLRAFTPYCFDYIVGG